MRTPGGGHWNTQEDASRAAETEDPGPPLATHPLESPGLFEGDIAGVSAADLAAAVTGDLAKNAVRDRGKLWPAATIPYTISGQFGPQERAVIARAVLTFHRETCLR